MLTLTQSAQLISELIAVLLQPTLRDREDGLRLGTVQSPPLVVELSGLVESRVDVLADGSIRLVKLSLELADGLIFKTLQHVSRVLWRRGEFAYGKGINNLIRLDEMLEVVALVCVGNAGSGCSLFGFLLSSRALLHLGLKLLLQLLDLCLNENRIRHGRESRKSV